MRLIGVAGKARSGKDTAARFLIEEFGLVKYSFADPIKEAVKAMFGLTDEHVNGRLKETPLPYIGESPRRIMQTLGTEWGRDMIRPDLWVMLAQQQWRSVQECAERTFNGGMIVPDVRFEDEAEFIRSNGGLLIHIVRPDAPQIAGHVSEAGVNVDHSRDVVIRNDGDLDDLKAGVIDLVNMSEPPDETRTHSSEQAD